MSGTPEMCVKSIRLFILGLKSVYSFYLKKINAVAVFCH